MKTFLNLIRPPDCLYGVWTTDRGLLPEDGR